VEALLAILILLAVAAFVTVPLRRRVSAGEDPAAEDPRVADLEARKEAKYREIRDAQMDHAAGKLSDQDFRRQDDALRAEAIEILKELDRVRGPSGSR
jgi:flagellar biosynthesis/type III secretory pathway M-ring protein FliF/YscJ